MTAKRLIFEDFYKKKCEKSAFFTPFIHRKSQRACVF